MLTTFLIVTVFAASDSIRAYDRVPKNPACTRFAGEEASRQGFSQLLAELSGRPLEHGESALMLDVPYRHRLWSARRSCVPDTGRRWDHYEIPQARLEKRDRGVWRSYLLVVRKGMPAVPDTGFAIVLKDTCLVLRPDKK